MRFLPLLFRRARAALLIALAPAAALAQTGRLAGTVTDSAKVPLSGAQVTIVGTRLGAVSDAAGRYMIGGIPAGTYEVRVQRIGERARVTPGVQIQAGQETTLDVTLERAPLALAGVVISASRRAEKVTDAPATITRIDATAIENTIGNSFAPALKDVKGLDFIQVGITATAVNARGFNSAFNNRMLMMEDNRIAVLPENGLPVGSFTSIPKVDLDAIEVLVGPGSALYGADASNGVITLTTKDPKTYPGTTIEVAGGSRSFYDVQFRHAQMFGERLGFKVTGEYQAAKDFENRNTYAPISATAQPSQEIGADFDTNVLRYGGALVYYMPSSARLELNGGASKSNGIGITNVGRNQLVDWEYRHLQAKYSRPNWFAQVYTTQSLSGETYQLNGVAQNRLRFPNISMDSVKALSDFPAEGRLTAAELQNTFTLGQLGMGGLIGGMRLTWGGQWRNDVVSSKRQWLEDRNTGEDIDVTQYGVYGQLEQPLGGGFRAVVAGRYDKHDYYDAQWSPKAGLLYSPKEDHTVRVTFNRAFKSPTLLQTSFYFPDFQPSVGVFGNRDGFIVKNAAGVEVRRIDPIEPETNDTWELGYKGVLRNRLFLDVAGYYSRFDNFMSPLVIFANFLTPGAPTFGFNAKTGAPLVGATNNPQIPLTYFNVGEARIYGMDAGVRFLATPTIGISGTVSLQRVDTIKRAPGDPIEATAFNSPTTKMNLGMDFSRIATDNLLGSWTIRHVNGYEFLSGVNVGRVPTFSTFDFTLGYKLPQFNSRVNLSVQNLFTCRAGESNPNLWIAAGRRAIYQPDQRCGFGIKHQEMLNMPRVGTMVFLGVRWDR